ncbi:MAG: serine acetyltransferase [Phycisphaerae bacterium]|nr:serine acetyltransferase [Phycisphaerae bacterium]
MDERKEKDRIEDIIEAIVATYDGDSGTNFIDVTNLPVREKIMMLLEDLLELLFPGYTGKRVVRKENIRYIVGDILCKLRSDLTEQICLALRHECRLKNCVTCDCATMAADITEKLIARLPQIRELLKTDVQAAFNGDPAAKSLEEIVISYPYIAAITIHRIAHELHLMEVPLIPRIMSESAHAKTGIDIHPGAKIGRHFFIDHGTGVVVGETAVIGDNVKFYQGVSLVAISIPRDAQRIRGVKRHPTIEDDVTIYAEATILGNVTVGRGAVIGANAWVRQDVPPGVTVTMAMPEVQVKHHRDKHGAHKEHKKDE